MRIALIAPPALPTANGARALTDELARALSAAGHEVATFPGEDARSGVSPAQRRRSLLVPEPYRELVHASLACREVRHAARSYDVVHAHSAASLPFARYIDAPTVYTIHHDRIEGMVEYYQEFADVSFAVDSDWQAALHPELNGLRVVHPGVDPARYPLGPGGGYIAFLGALAKATAPHLAIDAARAAGVPLLLAGAADEDDPEYYQDEVEPRLTLSGIEPLGEVGHAKQLDLLANARAMVCPEDRDVVAAMRTVEAMMCGTPVVAFARGGVSELVQHGVTGFVVNDAGAMADAIRDTASLDRRRIRTLAEERFSHARMAKDYVGIYEQAAQRYRDAGTRPSVLMPWQSDTARAAG